MNVTASKVLLGVSLAAYAYTSWDHMFPSKAEAAPPPKGTELVAGMVNRTVSLKVDIDPFNSIPLNSGGVLKGGQLVLPNEPGKELGDLSLDGVMVTLGVRTAVINGKALHEGEMMKSPGGAMIRVKRIGLGFCEIEGGGRVMALKLADPDKPKDGPAPQRAASSSNNNSSSASGGATSATGNPYKSRAPSGGSAPARPAGGSATGNPYNHK